MLPVKPNLFVILLVVTATALRVPAFVGTAAACTRHWVELGLSATPFELEPSETAVVLIEYQVGRIPFRLNLFAVTLLTR
jgi:hypothetical protein